MCKYTLEIIELGPSINRNTICLPCTIFFWFSTCVPWLIGCTAGQSEAILKNIDEAHDQSFCPSLCSVFYSKLKQFLWIYLLDGHCLSILLPCMSSSYWRIRLVNPGAHPTSNQLNFQIPWKYVRLFVLTYMPDNKDCLHTLRQLRCTGGCKILLWSLLMMIQILIEFKFNWQLFNITDVQYGQAIVIHKSLHLS